MVCGQALLLIFTISLPRSIQSLDGDLTKKMLDVHNTEHNPKIHAYIKNYLQMDSAAFYCSVPVALFSNLQYIYDNLRTHLKSKRGALIKKKIKFSSYILGNSAWSSCKVIYD
jgi:hypothetical protein